MTEKTNLNGLLIQMFPDPAPVDAQPFLYGLLFVLSAALITVFTQIIKVAKSNPAEVLKNE